MLEIHKILVAIDFSEDSQRALDDAIELAQKFDAELYLLHCYQLCPPMGAPGAPSTIAALDRAIREAAQQRLSEWQQQASSKKVRAHQHLSANIPSEGIVEFATALAADLIVMGTRGLSGLKHVLLGSTAERTIRIAPCPVLVVKRGAGH